MARGGYIKPEVAVVRLYKTLGSRDVAKVGIYDALVSGALLAKGCRILRYKLEPTSPGVLRDMATAEATLVLGDQEDIPPKYWKGFLIKHVSDWDWESGHLRNPTWGDHFGYQDVVLKEKDVNTIVSRLKPPAESDQQPKERRRKSTWNEWVAAATILAAHRRIESDMNTDDLINAINAILDEWNLEPKYPHTVREAAVKILQRFDGDVPKCLLAS